MIGLRPTLEHDALAHDVPHVLNPPKGQRMAARRGAGHTSWPFATAKRCAKGRQVWVHANASARAARNHAATWFRV